MSMLSRCAAVSLALFAAQATTFAAEPPRAPHLGKPMSAGDVAKWNLSIYPDGRGLPEGEGTAIEGEVLYKAQCQSCHGEGGRGATAEELVAEPQPLTDVASSKAIGPYWPYATTLFDFIRRSMPPQAPGSLAPNQIYALTAYLLAANQVIPKDQAINAKTLPAVKMPNRDGFEAIDAAK